jgi:DinB superfamily
VLVATVSLVPEELRDQRLVAEEWSVAETLEHLERVESGISRLLARTIERARAEGLAAETEAGSLLGTLDGFDLLRRDRRMASPDLVSPQGKYTAAQALAALGDSRRSLIAALLSGDGLALGQVSRPHILLGPLNLYQWALFVGQHEARHAIQIDELARKCVDRSSG